MPQFMPIEDTGWVNRLLDRVQPTRIEPLHKAWARALAGENERVADCSARTLTLVQHLTRDEAKVVAQALSEVCYVTNDDDTVEPFLNVFIYNRVPSFDHSLTLFGDSTEERRARDRILKNVGFIDGDFSCSFCGEGGMNPQEYHISRLSAKSLRFGTRHLVASHLQPHLLEMHPNWPDAFAHFHRQIEFDAWALTAEAAELAQLLAIEPNYALLDQVAHALAQGGLSFTITE